MTEDLHESATDDPPVKNPEPISSGPLSIALASIRNIEAFLRWQGAQWSIALNLSAIVAIMYRVISVDKVEALELFVLAFGCTCGALLDFEWYSTLRRNGKLFDFWNRKLTEHERRNEIRGGMKLFTSREYQRLASSRDRLQRRLERISVFFIILWAVAAVAFLTLAVSTNLKGGV